MRRGIDEKWWPSIIFNLSLQARCSVNNLISRHKKKLEKLPERQYRPLKNLDERSVRNLDEVVLPLWVREVLNLDQNIRYESNLIKFASLRTLTVFFTELKLNRLHGEKL